MRSDEAPASADGGVEAVMGTERAARLDSPDAYRGFADRVEAIRRNLRSFLDAARGQGQTVIGYGAPVKGNTLLNSCGVTSEDIAYTVDISPRKQGTFHLPVRAPSQIVEDRPDYVLILPWNLKDEIVRQMADIREWGGQFVVPIPRVEVLD
jgi:hypothetical protein